MRTRAEIDAEYSAIAKAYGDRVYKATMLEHDLKQMEPVKLLEALRVEIQGLFSRMNLLRAEPSSDGKESMPPQEPQSA